MKSKQRQILQHLPMQLLKYATLKDYHLCFENESFPKCRTRHRLGKEIQSRMILKLKMQIQTLDQKYRLMN
jgi:hypothetical protein